MDLFVLYFHPSAPPQAAPYIQDPYTICQPCLPPGGRLPAELTLSRLRLHLPPAQGGGLPDTIQNIQVTSEELQYPKSGLNKLHCIIHDVKTLLKLFQVQLYDKFLEKEVNKKH